MRHLKRIARKNRRMIAVYLACGLSIALLNSLSAGFFQRLIDRFSAGTLALSEILVYGGILLTLCLLNYLANLPEQRLKHGLYMDVKLTALEKLSRIDYLTSQSLGTGMLIQRIENGASAGRDMLFDFWLNLITNLLPAMAFSLLMIGRISPMVTRVILLGYVVVFAITKLLLRALYRIKERILIGEEVFNRRLVRAFTELTVFRIHRRFGAEAAAAREESSGIVDGKVRMTMIHEAFFTLFALIVTLFKIGILLYGWHTGELTIGAIVALLSLVDNAYQPVAIFNVEYVQYRLNQSAFSRLTEFLDAPDDPQLDSGRDVTTARLPLNVRKLRFRYDRQQVFEGLSLTINPGEQIALVGESGSGKTTLVKLLIGLIKPTGGEILLGDTPLSALKLNSLYARLFYVSQESPVFDGTLRENLIFSGDVPDAALLEALRGVQLDGWFARLPEGWNTPLGERGVTLSGGERQRLALARLWFADADIVILDEATSALDSVTEAAVMDALMQRLRGCTVLSIVHRLETLPAYPRILVFEDGQIVGDGTHDSLMRACPAYRQLHEANQH